MSGDTVLLCRFLTNLASVKHAILNLSTMTAPAGGTLAACVLSSTPSERTTLSRSPLQQPHGQRAYLQRVQSSSWNPAWYVHTRENSQPWTQQHRTPPHNMDPKDPLVVFVEIRTSSVACSPPSKFCSKEITLAGFSFFVLFAREIHET